MLECLLNCLSCEAVGVENIIELNCTPDGRFPHNPEPLPQHLTQISDLLKSGKADVGFVVDPDVDRLAIICENGEMFGEEYTLVSVADYILRHTPGNLHHGHIEVDSMVGQGTTVTILLHTGKEHFDADVDFISDEITAMTPPSASSFENKMEELAQEPQDNRRTILVVDDSQDMAQFLVGIFNRDYNVESAADGEEAEQIIRSKHIDLVVTDLMMPNVDGLELTQFIKQNPDTDYIPVILLTAKTAIESRLQALQFGADDYVTKPFEPEYLRARVQNILAQRTHLEQSYRQRLMRLESQKNDEAVPGDSFLAKLLDIMDKQMDNNTLTVDELVEEMGMGRTVFFNKLKSLTGLSPVEFIREMRIKRAAQLLEDRKYNITEVTYMVGMNDSRYFSKCFKNTYGVTPSEYRKQRFGTNERE